MEGIGDGGTARDPARETGGMHFPAARGVVVGDHATQHNHFHGDGRVARAAYLEQVREDIAPAVLRDREWELEELADFCRGDEPYIWWQAGPWAGKSALVAWFALHPPQGMDVACFFITGRLAAQADSSAFTEALLEQLASLLGEQLPASPALSVRDSHRRELLREAARSAREHGRRLVLVIDGLDQDRSRRLSGAAGEGLPSIASLLPRRHVDGLRVIVSGRPDPEIPDDVPGDHPLRSCAVRRLAPSPHARDIERLAREELRRLLSGGEAERDVLGLVTAAGGGLAGGDLEKLTGLPPYEIGETLSGVVGRTFTRRPSRWAPGSRPGVYLLAHEELQAASAASLGENRLMAFRERLHAWADEWRRRHWPAETPEYLLGGYGEMLREHDSPRLVALAADGARIDRMLEVTGSDADAIAEVDAAIGVDSARGNPDLAGIALLAYQRDRLAGRNSGLPARLPAAWVRAGKHARAEALARSFTGESLVQALAWTSIASNDVGDQRAAARLIEMACRQLPQVPGQSSGYWACAGAVAAALARNGEAERAEAVLAGIGDTGARDRQLVQVAVSMGRAGKPLRAEAIAVSAHEALFRVKALAGAAGGLALAGQAGQATRVASAAEALARTIDDVGTRDAALSAAARAEAMAGRPHHAETLAADISDPGTRGEALAGIAAALTMPEHGELAMRLVETADSLLTEAEARDGHSPSFSRLHAADDLARALVGAGKLGAAEALARMNGSADVDCLISIAEKLARAGKAAEAARILAEAEAAARGPSALKARGDDLITIAGVLTAVGAPGPAAEALSDIEALAAGDLRDEVALRDLAEALAAAGEGERCAAIADAIRDPKAREYVMAQSAILLADAGKPSQALDLATRVKDPKGRAWAYPSVIAAMAKAQDFEQAERLAAGLPDPDGRSRALASVAVERAVAGQRAAALTLVGGIDNQQERYKAMADVAPALARSGQADEAIALSDIPVQSLRGQALAGVARSLAETGQVPRARQLAGTITSLWWQAAALAWIADAFAIPDAAAQAEILTGVDQLLTAAQQADDEEDEHLRLQGRPVLQLGGPAGQHTACWAASVAFARAGQTERAVRAACLVPHPKSSRRALEKVTVTLAESGYTEAAMSLLAAGGFRNPKAQVQAKVALALARAGQQAQARDLIVTAIKTGHWNSWLWALGEISLPDLLRLAEGIRSGFRWTLSAASAGLRTRTRPLAAGEPLSALASGGKRPGTTPIPLQDQVERDRFGCHDRGWRGRGAGMTGAPRLSRSTVCSRHRRPRTFWLRSGVPTKICKACGSTRSDMNPRGSRRFPSRLRR